MSARVGIVGAGLAGFVTPGWWAVRTLNHDDRFAPPGQTLIQVMMGSAWAPWRALRDDKAAYKDEKNRLAAEVLEALETLWPGVSSRVDMTDVATPYTWYRYTLNREGAWEGFALTARALKTSLKRTLPGLEGLYLAGQWIVPGGGVVPCLASGRQAVMLMCRDDGRDDVAFDL
jgi:phytoene dehydrogenase-like protein